MNARRSCVIACVLVLLNTGSWPVLSASEGGAFCDSISFRSEFSCEDCVCVAHCDCVPVVGIQMCSIPGRICYYAYKINFDEATGPNCRSICCIEYNWDCELP